MAKFVYFVESSQGESNNYEIMKKNKHKKIAKIPTKKKRPENVAKNTERFK